VLLLGASGLVPARAADQPSLKDILGKAQSQHEKAVEDLIDKLKGSASKKPQSAPIAPEAPKDVADPAPATPPAPAKEAAPAPALPDNTDSPPPATASAETPAQISPEVAVERADQQELPSVDLEILFAFDSAEITPEAVAILTTLGRALSDVRLAGDGFLIAGHTDAKGRADYNLRLSESSPSISIRMLAGRSRPRATPISCMGSSTPRTFTVIAGPRSCAPAWRATSDESTI
jgi:outer membrane protein OmpA-like peptidoglycan-associated protein